MMAALRIGAVWLALLLPSLAAAQDAPPPVEQAPGAPPAEAAPAQAAPAAPATPAVPPVVVIPVAADTVNPPIAQAVLDAVTAQLRPLVARRDVVPLGDQATLDAVKACTDSACVGGIVARAGAISGVLIRMDRRRPRDPVNVVIGVVDPVSGNPRGEPVTGAIPRESVEAPADVLAPLVASLAPLMPAAPRRTTLLVASNVDGAAVRVDETEVGRTPLAPGNVEPGRHVVTVTRPGFLVQRRELEIEAGQHARIDIDLEPTAEQAASDALSDAETHGGVAGEGGAGGEESLLEQWWFWAAVGGGAVAIGIITAVIIVASSGDNMVQTGIPIPPIH
jgi:hypothetical protein